MVCSIELAEAYKNLCQRTDYEKCEKPRAARFDIETMSEIMSRLDNPHLKVPSIHIAGSKGKGSVASYISRALGDIGMRVGVYSSPHLSDWRERVQVNHEFIDDDQLAKSINLVVEVAPDSATFFDLLTASAFYSFSEMSLDCMVIEVGLGGRFDSTNVLQPIASLVTSIELEHSDVLGDSLSKIAYQKGGIYKKGSQLWCASEVPVEAKKVLREIADTFNQELNVATYPELVAPDTPNFFASNKTLAVSVLASLGEPYSQGVDFLNNTSFDDLNLPGRFELRYSKEGRPIIFDVAHSPKSLEETLRCFRSRFYGEFRDVLFAFRDDKDIADIAKAIGPPLSDENWYCCPAGDHPRSARADKIGPCLNARPQFLVDFTDSDHPLLVTGSTYLVGALRPKTFVNHEA